MKQPGKIAIYIFVIVMLAVVIVQAGRYSFTQDNGTKSYGPSGTSAMLQLIRESGYKVDVTNTRSPEVGDLVIVPVSGDNDDSFIRFLRRVSSKSRVLVLNISRDISDDSQKVTVNQVKSGNPLGQIVPFNNSSETWKPPILQDSERNEILTVQGSDTAIAEVIVKKDLEVISVADASFVVNRNIDKVDNANVLMTLVGMVAKPGQKIQLIETFAADEVDANLLTKLGPPYQMAWSQLLILVFVIFVSLSVRFGLAPEWRAQQRGGRELVDGLAWMTRRKRSARWALRAVFDRTLAELERRHRISRDRLIQRPDLYLNIEDASQLKRIEAATMDDISEAEAVSYAKELKRLV